MVPSGTADPLPTIAELVLSDSDRFSTLENLLVATGLLDFLNDEEGPLTVFAPTNEAFESFDLPEDLDAAVQIIANIVTYHVVNGEEVVLVDGAIHTTVQGQDVLLTVSETNAEVNDANIEGSAAASNGIVYIIDAVLVPGEDVAETTVPSPAPVDFASLAPSIADDVGSLVPTLEGSTDESQVPTLEAPIDESQVPTVGASDVESQVPTVSADTALPTFPVPTPGAVTLPEVSSSAPSSATSTTIESLAPSSVEPIESIAPTDTTPAEPLFPGVEPQCTAHPECLMVGMDDLCCPTVLGVYLDCCDLGDIDTTPPVTADPLGDGEGGTGDGPEVQLTPTNAPGCMKVKGSGKEDDEVMLATCNGSDPMQKFKFVGNQVQLAADSSMCLQAGRQGTPSNGKYLRVFTCDSSNDLQDFTWDAPDGRLYPTSHPDVTVVYRGTTPNVNADRIIVADITVPEVRAREGWKPL